MRISRNMRLIFVRIKRGVRRDFAEVKSDMAEHKHELKIANIIIKVFLLGILLSMFLVSFLGGGPAFIGCDGKPVYLGCQSRLVYAADSGGHPTVEATNNSSEDSNTFSHTVSLPTNIQAGETLLVFFAADGDNVATFPEGWTNLFGVDSSVYLHLTVAWRKADGGEGASITVTTSDAEQSAHISYRISGAIDPTVTPPEASAGVSDSNYYPDPDSLTPGGGSDKYLWLALACKDLGTSSISVYPTNYTDGEYRVSAGSFGCMVTVARRENETDSEDPGTFTSNNVNRWIACTVAVYPAVPPDPPAGLVSFSLESQADNVTITWEYSENGEGVRILRSVIGEPSNKDLEYSEVDGWTHFVYQGAGTEYIDDNLDLWFWEYHYSAWEYNEVGFSDGYLNDSIGGGDMEIAVTFPVNYWIFGAACIMLGFAVFFKKLILYIALVPLWIGVIATAGNIYIDSAAGCVLLFAIIGMRQAAKNQASGGV